jgi:hypothetical protein
VSEAEQPQVEQNRRGFAEHNVTAAFPDMDAARRGLGTVEAAGVDSSKVSLIGPRAEQAAEETDTRRRDLESTREVGKKAVIGAAAGTAGGGAVGFLAGLAAFAIPGVGPVIGTAIWGATIAGGVAGGAVGGMVGGYSATGVNDAWELTYQEVRRGRVVVGVHSDDPAEVDRAEEALRGLEPLAVNRFDREGRGSTSA